MSFKFTIKDFIKNNSPCLNCQHKMYLNVDFIKNQYYYNPFSKEQIIFNIGIISDNKLIIDL